MFLASKLIENKHGFFTRMGGVSTGEYASLNCGFGSGDQRELVQQNRDIVMNALGGNKLITAYQTHSDICHIINGHEEKLEGDALVTNKPGIAIGILTADCGPILFEDKKAGVIGAAHAGWKGARFGIIGSTIRAMEHLGASEITAVLGPCIHHESYEVSEEFLHVFATEGPQNGVYFTKSDKEGHYQFDLPAYIEMKLKKNGIENIEILPENTYTQADKFYSFRRGTHEGRQEYGRLISAICL